MLPLYPMSNLRGMHFQGIHSRSGQIYRSPGSEDLSDDDTDPGSGSVRSVPSPTDDLYDLDVGRSNFSEEYAEYLHDDLAQDVDGSSESDEGASASSRSPIPTPTSRLIGFQVGLPDSELSDPPDYLDAEGETDEETHETESEGELSNLNSVEDEDPEDDEDFDEVPNPPCLPSVPEERLQGVWPLGDQSFSIFLCPITHDVMMDPVVSADGYTYERAAIARWFETSRKSPVTGQILPHTDLVPNHSVRTLLKTLIDMTDDGRMAGLEVIATRSNSKRSPAAECRASESSALEASTQRSTVTERGNIAACAAVSAAVEAAAAAAASVASANAASRAAESRRHSQANSSEMRSRAYSPPRDEGRHRLSELRHEQAGSHSMQHLTPRTPPDLHFASDAEANALDEASAILAAASPALARMQQRAQSGQVLTSGPSSSSLQRMPTGHGSLRSDRLGQHDRPASQPQPHLQHSLASSSPGQTRPQSSTGCPQRPQAPSTTLPPLRFGQTPPRHAGQAPPLPPDHGAARARGASPPLSVPPLSYHSGTSHGRLPSQPPSFPPPAAPLEGVGSQGSGNRDQRPSMHSPGLDTSPHRGSTHKRHPSAGIDHL